MFLQQCLVRPVHQSRLKCFCQKTIGICPKRQVFDNAAEYGYGFWLPLWKNYLAYVYGVSGVYVMGLKG